MKRIAAASTAVLVALFAVLSPAIAQKPATSPGSVAAPAIEPPQRKSPSPPASRTRSDADARHCLDLATYVQIIRCAEKYL